MMALNMITRYKGSALRRKYYALPVALQFLLFLLLLVVGETLFVLLIVAVWR